MLFRYGRKLWGISIKNYSVKFESIYLYHNGLLKPFKYLGEIIIREIEKKYFSPTDLNLKSANGFLTGGFQGAQIEQIL